ncbi:MAG: RdgB/HAM1 family non-canonical purine NTP pyrophosphatase [Pseudomonadales bacterium]|nr:RdgB/HAM1 family non-canonical purine NTP pyrophosphatase [Pseudomonadales bacterium]
MTTPQPSTIVLASGNRKKIAELQQLLNALDVNVVSQTSLGVSDVPETGSSFVENALIKARNACRQTGLPAIADDSGLEVFALQGQPGIYSARYSGENACDDSNNRLLLENMQGITNRQARFVCILTYMRHAEDSTPVICQGFWNGRILDRPVGENGFGYDPLFFIDDQGCTSAQLDPVIKNRISHRGQAMQQLKAHLQQHHQPRNGLES